MKPVPVLSSKPVEMFASENHPGEPQDIEFKEQS